MNRTDAPKKQPVPFGVNGSREDLLPTTPAGDNQASYDAGFPPVTMILKAAGGLPPKGQDMNQILYELSSIGRWLMAGALNAFDNSFAATIGGYPKASVIAGDDGSTIYISTIENNTNNPNTSSAGWLNLLKVLNLASLAGGSNKLPYFTGESSLSQTDLTAAGRGLIGQADVAAILTYLGLGGGPFVSAGGGDYNNTFKFGRIEVLPKESNAVSLYTNVGSGGDGTMVSAASFQWYDNRFDIGAIRNAGTGVRGLGITYNGFTSALINSSGDIFAVRGLFESGGSVRVYSPNNPPPAPTGFVTAGQHTVPQEVAFTDNNAYPKATDGASIHNFKMVGGASNVGTLVFRYLQMQINGVWVTINN